MPLGKTKKEENTKAKEPKGDTSEQTESKDTVDQQQSEGAQKSAEEQTSGKEQEKPQDKEGDQHSKEQQPEATEDSTGDTQGGAKDEAPENPVVDGLYQLVSRPAFFGRNKDPKYHFVKHDEAMAARYHISSNEGPDTLHLSDDEMSYISAPMVEQDYHIVMHASGKYFIHRPLISY